MGQGIGTTVVGLSSTFGLPVPVKVADQVSSWWCRPNCVKDGNRVHVTGVGDGGQTAVVTYDLGGNTGTKALLRDEADDDHNTPAILVPDDLPPLVAIAGHSAAETIAVRVGAAIGDVASLAAAAETLVDFDGTVSYATLIRKPGTQTVGILTRATISSVSGWWMKVSTDWGATWGTAIRITGQEYLTYKLDGAGSAHFVSLPSHPTAASNHSLYYFRVDLTTGYMYNAAGTRWSTTKEFWTTDTPMPSGNMTRMRQAYTTDSPYNTWRVLDIGPDGSILACRFNTATPEDGGQYGVFRFATTGASAPTSPDASTPDDPTRGWVWEPIVASGVPVGYNQSAYVGGGVFGESDDAVYLAREASGRWALERWDKHATFGWYVSREIDTKHTIKLGRPLVPWGAEGDGILTAIEYAYYGTGSTSYQGEWIGTQVLHRHD